MPCGYPAIRIAGCYRVGRVKRRLEAVAMLVMKLQGKHEMMNRRQHDVRRERQRGDNRPRCERAVVDTERGAAALVVEEMALDAVDATHIGTEAVARGDAPRVLAIAVETERIVDRIALLVFSK